MAEKSGKSAPVKKAEKVKAIEPEFFEVASTDEEFEGFNSTSSESDSDSDEAGELEVEVEANSSDSESEIEDKKQSKKQDKAKAEIAKLAKSAKAASKKTGSDDAIVSSRVVFVGRIPHGFYEDQMKDYFGQFGTITRLRLSRNKRTGASKHYAFIEFASPEVAAVVCETMDNYLLFGHILKVKPVDESTMHEKLFVGANRRYQVIPWGKVMKQRYERKHSREWWEELAAKEKKLRKEKAAKIKALGIDYTY